MTQTMTCLWRPANKQGATFIPPGASPLVDVIDPLTMHAVFPPSARGENSRVAGRFPPPDTVAFTNQTRSRPIQRSA